ncbi:hypothetical protein FRC09_002536, partial [Ceratobasidium sp. 395]
MRSSGTGLNTPPASPSHQSSEQASLDLQPEFEDPEPTGFIPFTDIINDDSLSGEEIDHALFVEPEAPQFLRDLQHFSRTLFGQLQQDALTGLSAFNQSFYAPDPDSSELYQFAEEVAEHIHQALTEGIENLIQVYPTPAPSPIQTLYWFPVLPINYNMLNNVSDNHYKIDRLKGRENYAIWKIQMTDMYEENDLWKYVTSPDSTQPIIRTATAGTVTPGGTITVPAINAITQANIDDWRTTNRKALGMLRRRVEPAVM